MAGDLPYLKHVSRLKHRILERYLAPWAVILGSSFSTLRYVDCFAGGGEYVDEAGDLLPGSPLMALRLAVDYVGKHPGHSLDLEFVEKDADTALRLERALAAEPSLPLSVVWRVFPEDAEDFVSRLTARIRSSQGGRTVPTFVFVDPYGHPITIPAIRQLLSLDKVEVFVNLMWYQINMDLGNTLMWESLDKLFGHTDWRLQPFLKLEGKARERGFLDYFITQVGPSYRAVWIPLPFSREDGPLAGTTRTKYYLVHFSTHPKAAMLMKECMLPVRDGLQDPLQLRLLTPAQELRDDLLAGFKGKEMAFDELVLETLAWPFLPKVYREVLRNLEGEGLVRITRVDSKKSGLKGRDRVWFL